MTGWQKQARLLTVNPLWVAAILLVAILLCDPAAAQIAVAPDGTFVAMPSANPQRTMMWQMLIGGFVIFAFLASVILWVMTALRKARHASIRRSAFVGSALNNLTQGIVMVDARERIVFCNDRYLGMYGLSRSDLYEGMTGRQIIELRSKKGNLPTDIDQYYRDVRQPNGHICELKDGRSIHVKHRKLANGGLVSTHDDCSEQRKLAKELASTKTFLESVIDNIPVCVAAKSIEDGRYILANRAFEQFSAMRRDQIVGRRAEDIYTAATARSIAESDQAALASPDSHFRNEFVVERGGKPRLLASNRVIARNDKNEPEYLIALFEDVTERRSLSREIKDAKKFLELVVDNVPVALVVKRLSDGQYVLAKSWC